MILTVVFGWLGIATVLAVFFGIKCHTLSTEAKNVSVDSAPQSVGEYITKMKQDGYSSKDILEYIHESDNAAFQEVVSGALSLPAMADTAPASTQTQPVEADITTASEDIIEPPDDVLTSSAQDAPMQISEASAAAQTTAAQTTQTAASSLELSDNSDDQSLYENMYAEKPASKTSANAKTVFLTFEGEPCANTSDILIILGRQNINATFFVSSVPDSDSGEILASAVKSGNTVGILAGVGKSYSSAEDYIRDFYNAYTAVSNASGINPDIYRIPDSAAMTQEIRSAVVSELDRRGFTECTYNTNSNDSTITGWQELYDSVTGKVYLNQLAGKPSVVLMHSSSSNYITVLTTEDIVIGLKRDGYSFAALKNSTEIK